MAILSPENELNRAADELLDLAISRHPHVGGDDESETFLECNVCGEWEGHRDGCFVPALETWLTHGLPSAK
jgi:hypothetical protein